MALHAVFSGYIEEATAIEQVLFTEHFRTGVLGQAHTTIADSQDDLYGLATLCRALLTLHQHAGPPTWLTARTTESRP